VEHALAELKRENNSPRKTYMVVVNGELLSVDELRRRDRRFASETPLHDLER
jgi:hypothetical protein